MRFMIVDDDSLVRIALKTMLNWEAHGFELVGEAADGREALSLIEERRPDIVILDVRMPVLDGVGVLRELRSKTQRPRVIVVSSHGDFALVKEAMQLGVEDYLLKLDISFDNLLAVMERVAGRILAERRESEESERRERHLNRHLTAMRKEFYRNLVGRFNFSDKDLEDSVRYLNIPVERREHVCFLVKIEGDSAANQPKEERQITDFAVMNIVEEIVGEAFECTCFEWGIGEFYCMGAPKEPEMEGPSSLTRAFSGSQAGDSVSPESDGAKAVEGTGMLGGQSVASGESPVTSRENLAAMGGRLVEILGAYLNIDACLCIGVGGTGIDGIRQAGERAEQVLLERYLKGMEKVLIWSEADLRAGAEAIGQSRGQSVLKVKELLMTALVTRNEREIDAVFDGLLQDFRDPAMSRERIRTTALHLYAMIREYLEQSGVKEESLATVIPGYDELLSATTAPAAGQLFDRIRHLLIRQVRDSAGTVGDSLLRARRFIQQNFSKEISLQDVADSVGMNASYLSHLLKKKTGMNYTEYLIHLRIRRARELIRSTDEKFYVISEQVGYPNTFYFTRLFKRETGQSPSEYRRMVRGEPAAGELDGP